MQVLVWLPSTLILCAVIAGCSPSKYEPDPSLLGDPEGAGAQSDGPGEDAGEETVDEGAGDLASGDEAGQVSEGEGEGAQGEGEVDPGEGEGEGEGEGVGEGEGPPDCVPEIERCNGRDDDCDEVEDNGFDVGEICHAGVGVCETEGRKQCAEDGRSTECSAVPRDPGPREVCGDGEDNDCSGIADDGCDCDPGTRRPCGLTDEGVCQDGELVCGPNGKEGDCIGADAGSEETCNGLDDDCDGDTDETFPEAGVRCTYPEPGRCSVGEMQCRDGGLRCARLQGPLPSELCNSQDDDCDDDTDEGNPGGGLACGTNEDGVCAAGTTRCTAGVVRCERNVGPSSEDCNGRDDDCDGNVDEGLAAQQCNPGCGIYDDNDDGVRSCEGGDWGSCSPVRCGDDLVAQAPVDRGWARACDDKDKCFELEIIVAPDCIGGLEFNVRKFEIDEFLDDVDLEIVNVSSGRTLARAMVGGEGGLSVRRIVGAGSLRDTLRVRGTDSLKAVVYSPAGCEGNDCYTQATGTRRVEECGR